MQFRRRQRIDLVQAVVQRCSHGGYSPVYRSYGDMVQLEAEDVKRTYG